MQNLVKENQALGEEVRNAQENLRLSANQISKLNNELNDYRIKIEANNTESESYKQRIHKLMSENTSLSDEVNIAQENLRLSANTVSKLNNELKIVCNENEELQRRLGDSSRKGAEHENKVAMLSQ